MSEEIITIKTEEVKVSELTGRDKQIYDYAYQKGRKDAINFNKEGIALTIYRCTMILAVVIFFVLLLKSCQY